MYFKKNKRDVIQNENVKNNGNIFGDNRKY